MHCMPGYVIKKHVFQAEIDTNVANSPNGALTNPLLRNQKWISESAISPESSLTLQQIIMMLLFCSLFSSRPLLIHFRERRHHDRWDTSPAHVLPLRLRRPIHTAQGAICAVLLLEGVQGRGMETRQLAAAPFSDTMQNMPNTGFVTIRHN